MGNTKLSAIIKFVVSDKAWLTLQLVNVASAIVMSFLTLYLLSIELVEKEILLFFGMLFLMKALLLNGLKTLYLKHERLLKRVTGGLVVLLFASYLLFLDTYGAEYIYLLGVIFLTLFSTFFIISGFSGLQKKAKSSGLNEIMVLSVSGIMVVIIGAVSLPLIGFLASGNKEFMITVSLIGVLWSLLLNMGDYNRVPKGDVYLYKTIPSAVKKMYGLGFFMNASVGFGRQFIIPLVFYTVATRYGFSSQSLGYFGIFLGIIAVFALFIRGIKISNVSSYRLMIGSYLICAFMWMCVGIAAYIFETTEDMMWLVMVLVFVLLADVVAKFWTSGYLSQLRLESEKIANVKNTQLLYRSLFYSHMAVSTCGAAVIYLLAYFLSGVVSMSVLLAVSALLALLNGIVFAHASNDESGLNASSPAEYQLK
jgi:hypothetical protein